MPKLPKRKRPQRKTIALIKKAVQTRLEMNHQTWEETTDWMNQHGYSISRNVLLTYFSRYPETFNAAMDATMEKLGREASRIVGRQRIRSFKTVATLAPKADKRLEDIIEDDDVSPAVHVEAIKHVHSTIGMGTKGESVLAGSFSAPKGFAERGKELLAAYGFGVLTSSGEKKPLIEAEVEEERATEVESAGAVHAGGSVGGDQEEGVVEEGGEGVRFGVFDEESSGEEEEEG